MVWSMRAGSQHVEFGDTLSGLGLVADPEISLDAESEMVSNPRGDGRRPGQDFMAGQVVSLLVEALPDHRPLDEVWRELFTVWRGDEVRGRGGLLAELTAHSGRRALGRPRPIAPDMKNRVVNVNRAELTFEAVDDLWYGPEEVTTIRFVPVFTGGLPVPAAVPWVLGGGSGESSYMVTVGGDVAAWPVFELHGPILDPFIEVVGVGRLVFRGELAYDQTLTVDTRHWARWVKRNGAAFPGALSPAGSRLSDMSMRPGAYQVFFGGHDPTGSSSLDVRVSPAFTSF